jgi:hypothetical protein
MLVFVGTVPVTIHEAHDGAAIVSEGEEDAEALPPVHPPREARDVVAGGT